MNKPNILNVLRIGERVKINDDPILFAGRLHYHDYHGRYGTITDFDFEDDCFLITLDGVNEEEVYFPDKNLERIQN
jgi:ribosomal protein L21E